jgi:hypothetical protein
MGSKVLVVESYPTIHAKGIIAHPLNVVTAVQTFGTRVHVVQPQPHQVFVRTEEVTASPGHEVVALGPGRGSPVPFSSRGTLDRTDQRQDGEADSEWLEHCWRDGATGAREMEGATATNPGLYVTPRLQ